LRVLVAESKAGASSGLQELLGTNAFEVLITSDAASAEQAFDELAPTVVIVDVDDSDLEQLAERIRSTGAKVLPIALLERPLALLDPAWAALR
jgi:DNA-binding response OmpR family regulator